MRIIALAILLLPLASSLVRAEVTEPTAAAAAYCVAVFDDEIAKSKWALSLTHSQDAVNDIARMSAKRDAAIRVLSQSASHISALDSSNPNYANAVADIHACKIARKAFNARDCLLRCMADNAGGQCMDNCFIAGSAECSRIMDCMRQSVQRQ